MNNPLAMVDPDGMDPIFKGVYSSQYKAIWKSMEKELSKTNEGKRILDRIYNKDKNKQNVRDFYVNFECELFSKEQKQALAGECKPTRSFSYSNKGLPPLQVIVDISLTKGCNVETIANELQHLIDFADNPSLFEAMYIIMGNNVMPGDYNNNPFEIHAENVANIVKEQYKEAENTETDSNGNIYKPVTVEELMEAKCPGLRFR